MNFITDLTEFLQVFCSEKFLLTPLRSSPFQIQPKLGFRFCLDASDHLSNANFLSVITVRVLLNS